MTPLDRREWLRALALGGGTWWLGASAGSGQAPAARSQTGAPRPGTSAAPDMPRNRQEPHLLVRNGRIVNADGQRDADVRVQGRIITELGRNLDAAGAEVIDAAGLLVMPGGIDPHVHLGPPLADDFTSASRAALAGGITTFGVMLFPEDGEGPQAVVDRVSARAARETVVDLMLHPVVQAVGDDTMTQVEALAAAGHTSIKIFMSREGFDRGAPEFLRLVAAAGRAGVLTMVHCEDASILAMARQRLRAEGRTSVEHFAASRPVLAEEIATERAAAMCEATGSPLYLVHVSSERALKALERGQARGLPLFAETRPFFLHLTEDRLVGPDGPLFVSQPPLRTSADQDALWGGLARGSIHTVATDHVPWTREQKLDPTLDIESLRPGASNLQVMLPMLYSEGVRPGRIRPEEFVAATSTNAARLFGIHPRKGVVAEGADADLLLLDPTEQRTVRSVDAVSGAGFSVFDGTEVTGWPRHTIRRGEVLLRDGAVAGVAGSGAILERDRWRPPEGS